MKMVLVILIANSLLSGCVYNERYVFLPGVLSR